MALAPVGAWLGFAWAGLPVLLVAVPIAAIAIFLSGERLSWPSAESWMTFAATCAFIGLIAVVGQCAELLFSDRIVRVWVPDPKCIDVSRAFGDRLIARDLTGAYALLATEKQTAQPMAEFYAAVERFWNGCGALMTVESAAEDRLEEDYVSGDFDTQLESGSSFVAVTQVCFSSQQRKAPSGQVLRKVLTIYLCLEGEEYRVLDYQERS